MEESKQIKIPIGDVSLEPTLGNYYIDMRPARIHYKHNIWGGKFDENGVPMIQNGNKLVYNPVNIAQYGFVLLADYNANNDDAILNTLEHCINIADKTKSEYKQTFVWWYNDQNLKYNIAPPWACSMAQGEMMSFYLRMYQITQNKAYLETANKTYDFLKFHVNDKGVRRYDEYGNLWFEEYPAKKPTFVLNGFIYTLWGLYDLHRVTKRQDVKQDIDACILTLKNRLHEFDAGFWSCYDLQKKELVRYYYQKNVHAPQMEVLYYLTHDAFFLKYKEKWEKQLTWFNYLLVQVLYRVQYRLPEIYNSIIKLWKS